MELTNEKVNAPDKSYEEKREEISLSCSGMYETHRQETKTEKINRQNMERCASFVARMIEKYGKEVLAEIEMEEQRH